MGFSTPAALSSLDPFGIIHTDLSRLHLHTNAQTALQGFTVSRWNPPGVFGVLAEGFWDGFWCWFGSEVVRRCGSLGRNWRRWIHCVMVCAASLEMGGAARLSPSRGRTRYCTAHIAPLARGTHSWRNKWWTPSLLCLLYFFTHRKWKKRLLEAAPGQIFSLSSFLLFPDMMERDFLQEWVMTGQGRMDPNWKRVWIRY